MRTPFPITDVGLAERLSRMAYPRTNAYDPWWIIDNHMGPHPLWLAESISQVMPLPAGSRVLDLGCGKALTSIFLAREFDLQVTAADLWVPAEENRLRIEAAGLLRSVTPVHAEAHALPFAPGEFDAIVSFDAYHYFGTDQLYLAYVAGFLRKGGTIGIVVPGIRAEFDEVPAQLQPGWDPAFWTFHSPLWWRRHWQRTELVNVTHSDLVPDGWRLWLDWLQTCISLDLPPLFPGHDGGASEEAMLREDAGRTLGFTRLVAVKT